MEKTDPYPKKIQLAILLKRREPGEKKHKKSLNVQLMFCKLDKHMMSMRCEYMYCSSVFVFMLSDDECT